MTTSEKCKDSAAKLRIIFRILACLSIVGGLSIGNKLGGFFGFSTAIVSFVVFYVTEVIVCNILDALADIVDNTSKISNTSNEREEDSIDNSLPLL